MRPSWFALGSWWPDLGQCCHASAPREFMPCRGCKATYGSHNLICILKFLSAAAPGHNIGWYIGTLAASVQFFRLRLLAGTRHLRLTGDRHDLKLEDAASNAFPAKLIANRGGSAALFISGADRRSTQETDLYHSRCRSAAQEHPKFPRLPDLVSPLGIRVGMEQRDVHNQQPRVCVFSAAQPVFTSRAKSKFNWKVW